MAHASSPPLESRRITPKSSLSSLPSPTMSTWSRGHSNKSSVSSISSSPIPYRDSFDIVYNNAKRLEDVREEPHEPEAEDDAEHSFDDYHGKLPSSSTAKQSPSPTPRTPTHFQYTLGDNELWSAPIPAQQHPKRQRSLDYSRHSAQGFGTRFGSISKRWKHRSAAGPQLSIITHTAPTGLGRSVSDASGSRKSNSLRSFPRQEAYCPPSPIHSLTNDAIDETSEAVAECDEDKADGADENEAGGSRTPLLPPIMTNLKKQRESPIQSPLQSPSIAATPHTNNGRMSMDTGPFSSLPSPPLSSRPSLASLPHSRQNTATGDIPYLCLAGDREDFWSARLGHADFSIHPEPYMPETLDVDGYKDFRANWEQARKQYSQHLVRTVEHYGDTSKVFKLTEEKWQSIDDIWKKYDSLLHKELSPSLARLSDGPSSPGSPSASSILERPAEKVVVPPHDKSGKFPELGDSDIIGPLSVGAARVPELQRNQDFTPPDSPRKRNLVKFLSDIFNRH